MDPVAALILAAGGSTRLGQPKQLLRIAGESLVFRAVRTATEAGCAPIALVVGSLRAEIEAEVGDAPVLIVPNEQWTRGVGTSIHAGLRALLDAQPDLQSVVLLTCDQPFVDRTTLTRLIDKQRTSSKAIIASSYADTLGIPALFARSCFEELLALPDDSGAKPLIEARLAEVASIAFPRGEIDLDTPADLERLSPAPE